MDRLWPKYGAATTSAPAVVGIEPQNPWSKMLAELFGQLLSRKNDFETFKGKASSPPLNSVYIYLKILGLLSKYAIRQ